LLIKKTIIYNFKEQSEKINEKKYSVQNDLSQVEPALAEAKDG
jgi:hypothetical protein